jgi:signal transduction histidine kinase
MMARRSGLDTVGAVAVTPRWASRDDRWWAGAAAILALNIGAISLLTVEGWTRLEVAIVTLIVSAAFLARRQWPSMPTAVLVAWTFTPPFVLNLAHHAEGTLFLIVLATSYVALSEPDGRYRLAVLGVALAIPPIVAVAARGRYSYGWPYWMVGIAFGWVSGMQIWRFRLLVSELEAARQVLAEQAVFAERRRIASELHDLVGHSLTVVLLFLTGARHRVREDPRSAEEALAEAEEIGRRSLAEIRANVAALRSGDDPTTFSPAPTVGDLATLIDQSRSAGTSVGLDLGGPIDELEGVIAAAVYRVVQEGLANAAKHAPGANVDVSVHVDDKGVAVVVVDSGGVQAPAPSGVAGVGLIGMRERVESLGGQLDVGPEPGNGGWRVGATIPRSGGLS